MSDDVISVEFDWKQFQRQLDEYNSQIPNIATRLMRAVNNKVKSEIRREAKARGYSAHTPGSVDHGYSANLKSFANRDFSGKITMLKNGFYYRYIESGTQNRQTRGGANRGSITARPFIKPIARSYWETNKGSEIMEKQFQKELEKYFKG